MRIYNPGIYNIDIVLAKTEKEINRKYETPKGNEIEPTKGVATTYRINEKNGGCAAVGIVFRKKPGVDTIAHESFHAADEVMTWIGQDFIYDGTNEAWAYLIGWIALCVEDFVKKEFKEESK